MKGVIKRIFRADLFFFAFACMGALSGGLLAWICSLDPSAPAFAGGFAHAVPGTFSPRAIALAVLFQALPMVFIYYSAFGVLVRESSAWILFLRALLGGYCIATASAIGELQDPLFLLLFSLFVLLKLLTISLHASFAHLAGAFSRIVVKKKSRRAMKKFTGDFLFFYGLVLFFYIARGCIVALMNL